jgi:hypothetical protein
VETPHKNASTESREAVERELRLRERRRDEAFRKSVNGDTAPIVEVQRNDSQG